MEFINKSNNSSISLVLGLQQFVDSIVTSEHLFNSSQIRKANNSCSVSPNSSVDSSLSSSTVSNSFYSQENFITNNQCKMRPSELIKFDLAKYITKSARILQKNPSKQIMCTFCKTNGEPEHIYKSHSIKNIQGRVTCPLLKEYICPACGQSGENAHTITYCKKFKTQRRNRIMTEFQI
ncbi:nanos -like protein [Brachionus plicatilis]|uniref:Nanos-like protein n=1 Tax=Brachionus plicatilis TaxID=10195 RepID=A0A3M7QQP8_BRAPC|nr:nanos -like protein [Brachionus plicatilis]